MSPRTGGYASNGTDHTGVLAVLVIVVVLALDLGGFQLGPVGLERSP
ncbi:hypothetical protein [Actinokineospora sp. UTMC 2448]|nr:hypothetical protein [Actinokineospora sp. UTMC 2448]UVS77342.1 hypothetical protein Actkin_01051 [Actinokineospora sp. UTMC 2448]